MPYGAGRRRGRIEAGGRRAIRRPGGDLSPPWARVRGAAPVAGRSGIERDQEMTARTRIGVSRFFMIGEETGCMSAMPVR